MKIAEINMVSYASTGKIMLQIAEWGRKCGHEVKTFSFPGFSVRHPEKLVPIEGHSYVGTSVEHMAHYVFGVYTGLNGYYSHFTTLKLISELKKFSPDIIQIHNIHNWCVNLPMLFRYLKSCNASIVWTLHDCWTFTGHCPYFDIVGCEKWKTECHDCEQCSVYPEIKIDTSRMMHRKKKEWFSGFRDLTLVTPSQWLSGCAKESFLREYPIKVINNGIDLSVFKPIESNFREKWNIPDDKQILLGVSFGWGERKGLDVFIELEKRLDPDKYQIVLVGTDENVDASLPEGIISIHRTNDQIELAEIYTATDLFVNPTREEVFGLVNVEALACGTPVVTFRSGGSPECIDDTCGIVVEKNDVDAMEQAILYITKDKPFSAESCMAYAENFDMQQRFADYIKLYEQIMDEKAGLTNEQ